MTTKNRETPTSGGYTQRFERRPEFELWGSLVKDVVDAGGVRQRTVDDLKIFKISDVFAGNDEIFIGFGKPNAYLVVPDGQGGYQKFAGKSLRRAPSRIEDTRGFVQSGVLVRLKNLPQGAAEALRQAMTIGDEAWESRVVAAYYQLSKVEERMRDDPRPHGRRRRRFLCRRG